jgi:hypothetical protein
MIAPKLVQRSVCPHRPRSLMVLRPDLPSDLSVNFPNILYELISCWRIAGTPTYRVACSAMIR